MDKQKLWMCSMEIGAKMGCHQRAERSFSIMNYQFPLCARCTGILCSGIVGYWVYFKKKPKFLTGILLIMPMAIDGTIQLAKIKESTNFRRFVTGLLGGTGLIIVRLRLCHKLLELFRKGNTK